MLNTERYQSNLNVLFQLKLSKNVNLESLKNYSGWGGMREAIYTPKVYKELLKVLSKEEIDSIKKTLTSAYYTPKEIVKFIFSYIKKLGFSGGDILEPAIGNGVFIECMPDSLKQSSRICGVEIDKVTADICKTLYPNVEMYNCGFETFNPNFKYDLIVGNPPYGAQKIYDTAHQDLKYYRIHHYFVAKCMRLLKENGILAMVLPAYFMDNVDLHVRHIIGREGGEIITAYRLPDNLFQNAKVTIDIIFLRKQRTTNCPKWIKTRPVIVDNYEMPLNEYYHEHKENIIGKLAVVDIHGKKGLTCKNDTNINIFEKLREVANKNKELNLKLELGELKKHAALLEDEVKKVNHIIEGIHKKISELENQT